MATTWTDDRSKEILRKIDELSADNEKIEAETKAIKDETKSMQAELKRKAKKHDKRMTDIKYELNFILKKKKRSMKTCFFYNAGDR